LYKEKECIENKLVLFDNCGKKIKEEGECGEVSYSKDFCISDIDCNKEESCISGKCTSEGFIIGDGVCSLPEEDCSSKDCSCENKDIKGKGIDNYPIIIVHGFGSTPARMRELQRHLIYDLGYVNGKQISIFSEECPTNERKAIYLATYYETLQLTQAEKSAELMQASFERIMGKKLAKKGLSFDEIFEKIVDKVKTCSDSDKVNIIAHSMGGLVTRAYIANKENMREVNKMIVMGTPNHGGIYGKQTVQLFKGLEAEMGERKDLLRRCSNIEVPSLVMSLVDGRDVTKECEQLQQTESIESEVLLNDETPGLVEYYTIAGDIDGEGDGTVTVESVALDGAVFNKVVECDHFILKNPSRCEKAYYYIVAALGYDPFETVEIGFFDRVKDLFLGMLDFFG
jgi:hypothetical protein